MTKELTQDKVGKILSFVQMCKFFSHFGVRALLVLYMVQSLQFDDVRAFSVNAVFLSLVELSGIFGGLIADRFLGLRKGVLIGGLLLFLGFFGLIFLEGFFVSLSVIILGSSLFSSNIIAFFGRAIEENSEERKQAFTFFYMFQNIGALVSVTLSSFIATSFGFQMGFLVASLGMLLGNIVLFVNLKLLATVKEEKKEAKITFLYPIFVLIAAIGFIGLYFDHLTLPVMPILLLGCIAYFLFSLFRSAQINKRRLKKLFLYLGALILFFAAEDQMFSSLLLFSEREVDRELFGITVPSAFIMSLNPIVIFIFGKWIAKLKNHLIVPFLLMGGAFGVLAMMSFLSLQVSIVLVALLVIFISIGELMLCPMIYGFVTGVGTEKTGGVVMGVVSLGFSTAYLLGGFISQGTAHLQRLFPTAGYAVGFFFIALLMGVGGGIIHFLDNRKTYEKKPASS